MKYIFFSNNQNCEKKNIILIIQVQKSGPKKFLGFYKIPHNTCNFTKQHNNDDDDDDDNDNTIKYIP